jgi:hypothetical protein
MVVHYLSWSFSIGNLRNVHQFRLATRFFSLWISQPRVYCFLNLRDSRNVDVFVSLVCRDYSFRVLLNGSISTLELFLAASGVRCAGVCSRRWSDSGSEREVGCDSQE